MNPARLLAAALPRDVAPGLHPGGAFSSYALIEEVGRGAMGVVFTAQQHGSNRIVAIKFAHGSLASSPEAMRRFRTEAEAVAALDHPGVLPIYEVGEHEGTVYYTMRFAEAGSLAERLDWFAQRPREAAALVAAVAEAVQHTHERGILHRDLKPGNILLASRSEPLVCDFGLARWMQRETDVTASLAVIGTPDYLAPEMLRGAREGSTTSADIFSLGAILYHLLAGRAPFAGASVAEVLHKVEGCAPPPLIAVPRDLAAVCMKCLEREPSRRYAGAGALAADLRAWLDGRPVTARRVGVMGRAARWVRRKPVFAGLAGALALAFVALGVQFIASRTATRAIEQRRSEIARRLAQEQHRNGLLARAELRVRSHDAGRRGESLRLLREAWEIAPSVEIRSAAITALALPEIEENAAPPGTPFVEAGSVPEIDVTIPARILRRAFHSATRRLAVAAEDKLIYIVDSERGEVLRRLRGLEGDCLALAFSPDGHWLATVSDDQTLRVWEPRGGVEAVMLERGISHETPPLRWSRDGTWIEFAPGRTLRFTPPQVAAHFSSERDSARAEEVRTIDLSADGRWLVTVDEGGTHLWDVRTRRDAATFAKSGAEWSAARFSPDGRQLRMGGWNSALRVVELPEHAGAPFVRPRFVAELAGALIEQSADGSQLAALSNGSGGFQLRATSPPHGQVWLRHSQPLDLALSSDGLLAATSSFGSPGVRLWTLPSARVIREIPVPQASLLALSADGATLASGSGLTVTLWNTNTGGQSRTIPTRTRIKALAFSADGRLLAVEARDGVTLFRATPPFDEFARLATSPGRGSASFCFSGDSRRLAVQSAAGGAVVWNLDALHRALAELGMAWE